MADKIVIDIAVQGDAEVRLKKIGEAADAVSKDVKKSFLDAGRIFDNFIANLASSAVTSAFNVLKDGFREVAQFVGDSVAEAAEAEENFNNLRIALQSAGVTSEQAAQSFATFAGEIQKTTKFSDDAVLQAGALIEQLAKLDEEGLQQATTAAINLSAALGIDLQTAAQMVGKAANGEVGSFKKLGVSIKEGNTIAETFANTLETLNGRFGGAAAAQVNTFAGAQANLSNAFGELKEAIGTILIQNPVLIQLTKALSAAMVEVTNWVTQNKDSLSQLVTQGLLFAAEAALFTTEAFISLSVAVLKTTEIYLKAQSAISKVAQYVPGIVGDTAKLSILVADNMLPKITKALDTLSNGVGQTAVQKLYALKQAMEQTAANAESASVRAVQAGQMSIDQINAQRAEQTEKQIREAEQERARKEQAALDEIAILQSKNQMLAAEDQYAFSAEIAAYQAKIDAILKSEDIAAKKVQDIKKQEFDFKKSLNEKEKQDRMATLNYISTLQTAKTKELQVIGKAAAVTTATIDGVLAVQKALSAFPPPFNFIAAGLVGAATAANVAKIAGVDLATGITEVPAGYPNDTFKANLSSGERVVDAGTNQDLKSFLSGGGGANATLQAILNRIENLETNVTVYVGNKAIIDEVRDGIRSGRVVNV